MKSRLTKKQKVGDAANRWFARNRSLVLRQTPVWAQSLAVIVISLGSISVAAGIFFRIDEVVSVQGQLKSIGGTIEVKSPVGGKIEDIFYKDGDIVEVNQLLIRFDTTEAAQRSKVLKKLIDLEQKQLNTQIESINSQILTVDGRIKVLKQRLKTKTNAVSEMQRLVSLGGFQMLQFLDQKDQLFEISSQINELNEQKERLKLQASQISLSSQKSIDQMESELKVAELKLRYQSVKAPSSGIIFDPKASTQGVLSPGERILSIVPQKGLYAEVYVPNSDIGFVKVGQKAKIRVEAFPYTRYGELEGTVEQIGADALPPDQVKQFYSFPVKLKLSSTYLESKGIQIPLMSGMSVMSNLKLREKRVISIFSDLLVDQTDSIRSIRQQ